MKFLNAILATIVAGALLAACGGGGDGSPSTSPASSTAVWNTVASLQTARFSHTATLLPSGKVFVAGGYNASVPGSAGNPLASAELYDPAGDTWTASGALATARYAHTATLLPNGKILITGGAGVGGSVASSELYDSTINTWSTADALATARNAHTTTLLANGKVLVVGGSGNAGILASAELYDPATNVWTAAGVLTTARSAHTATLLPNGTVLVVGGYNFQGNNVISLASAELYDPSTNTWTTAGPLAIARSGHTATLLSNGAVLVAGGFLQESTNHNLASAELYDPTTNTWTGAGALAAARYLHTATLLPNGTVLIVGGHFFDTHLGNTLRSAELYDPASNTWTAAAAPAAQRSDHTATLLLNGQVLAVGGRVFDLLTNISLASAERYGAAP